MTTMSPSRRTHESLRLRNSPLVLVLGQVRFSAVLEMRRYVPAIQERLRKNGFPRFHQVQEDKEIRVQGFSETRRERSRFWEFLDADSATAVTLGRSQCTLITTAYKSFEDFTETFLSVAKTVSEVTEAELLERVALRYVDLVQEEGGHVLSKLLKPGAMGIELDQESSARFLGHASQLLCDVNPGRLAVNIVRRPHGTTLPPDLQDLRLELTKPQQLDGPFAILDFDISAPTSAKFASSAILEEAWRLHEHTDAAFRKTVEESALEYWKGDA